MIAVVAVVATLVAEGLVFAIVAELFAVGYSGENAHAVGWWAFALVALAGYYLPRFAAGFEMPARRAYALTAGGGLLLIYLLLRIEVAGDVAIWEFGWVADFVRDASETLESGARGLFGGLLLLGAWARGSFRSDEELEMETVAKALALPFLIVIVVVIFGAPSDRVGEIGRVAAGFFAVSVVALASSQLALSGTTIGEIRSGGITAVLLGGTALVAVVGFLLFGVLAGLLGPTVGPIISGVVETTLTILLTPLAWVLSELFERLFQGENPFANLVENTRLTADEAGDPNAGEPSVIERGSLYGMRILALIALAAGVAAIAVVFVRLRRRYQQSKVADGVDGSAGSAGGDLKNFLRSFLPGRREQVHLTANSEATLLYIEVLEQAAREGHPRDDGDTAREFAPVLQETYHAGPVVDDITAAFEEARYGGREPDPRTIAALRDRWRQVR